MFLPHINVNHASNTNSVVTMDNVRAADPVPVCVPRAGFLVAAAAAAEPVPEPEPIPARPSALSTAAADGFRETEYRADGTGTDEECSLWYKNTGRGLWRFYVYTPDRDFFSVVGPHYKTRSELLADLDRYAMEYGFPAIPRAGFLNVAEPAADPVPAEPTTEPEPVAAAAAAEQVAARPAAFLTRDSADDTFEDFEQREFYVLEFGRTLEADRLATIQGNRYAIEPRPESSGFQIQVTGADGFTETICSGYYGFEFNTFDRTVSYAVQRVRDRFVVEPERLCSNGCEISRRYHKRREAWVYAVTFPESLSGAKFKTQETRAKRCGGWYSREYRPEFQRGAFLFLSMRDADEFARDYRPTIPRNIPAEPAAVASNPPAAGFLDLQAELQDAETRVQRLNPRAGMTAAKWTVDGFDGTSGPPTVFDRKRDAIEFALNNRRAIEARRNGSPGGYKWFRAVDAESSDAVAPTEPVPGEFFAGTVKMRFSPTGNNGNQYGACEQCDRTQGSEYWSLTRTRPYRDEDGTTSYAHAGTQLICHDCAKRLQANLTASDAVAPTEPPAVPNFGDKVRTPDGIVGTMRGSGGLGSDRVGVADADGKLRTWANRSELQRVVPAGAVKSRADHAEAMAQKLEANADKMQSAIDFKMRPLTQNYTVKRGREYANRMHDGENLQRCQAALRFLARLWRAGNVPDRLRTLSVKSEVLPLVSEFREREYSRAFVGDERFHKNCETAKALRQLVAQHADPDAVARHAELEHRKAIEKAERCLRDCDAPGFFPTRADFADIVVNAVEIPECPSEDFFILEPSAGIGSLCEAIVRHCPTAAKQIDTVEQFGPAADVVELKGFGPTHRTDFLTINPDNWGRQYDAIVMNPPFERLQDIDHVRHAFRFLKPGGRLVAIMSAGSFFATSRGKAIEFGEWLQERGAWFVPGEDGRDEHRNAFTGADAFRQTGVNVRIVVIDRDE